MPELSKQSESELARIAKAGFEEIKNHIETVEGRVKALESKPDRPTQDELNELLKSDQIEVVIQAQIDSVKNAVDEKLDNIEARLALEAQRSQPAEAPKSWAEMVHDREEFKSLKRLPKGSRHIFSKGQNLEITGLPSLVATPPKVKAVTVLGATELGGLLDPFHRMTPVERLVEFSDMISWIRRLPIGGADVFDFPRETEASRLGYVTTTLTAPVAAIDTTIDVAEVEGIEEGTFLRIFSAAGALLGTVEVLSIASLTITLTAAAGFTASTDDQVTSENYGATAEQALKPTGWLEFEKITQNQKTIATYLSMTQQRLDALPQFEGFVENKLRMRARRNLGWHVVYGDDTDAGQWAGFMSDPGALSYLWSSGPAGDFRADAVVRAAALIHSGNALTAHMNIRDWNLLRLEKNTVDGNYALTSFGPQLIIDRPGLTSMGPIMVNVDGVMRDADFMVIDHALASVWTDTETAAFSAGFINDDFVKNIVRVRYEERGNHAIEEPLAVVNGEFDSQP